ncbi:hypothetical protein LOTGIDRAFT_157682 [Lottia gigantea]|uniref:Uncharacterized protein n=1 Tax=Lottia gigantea TaxID=225164 RepID=V4CES9_LOTGI|nr:hypothetical protein LOTGIDRAFT_157682 [Lottia gigantea]ESP00475.1 hypothetical protein LOTGIDRAFT_157682 [Lottia gigantea]
MQLVLILVAVVLVVNVEGWKWTPRIPRFPLPRFPIPRFPIPRIPSIPRTPWGKRNARQADDDAAFNAAAKDDVLSNDEIKSGKTELSHYVGRQRELIKIYLENDLTPS